MTVPNETTKIIYVGDALTSVFPYTFRIFANTQLRVSEIVIATKVKTLLALTTDYTIDGVGVVGGGNVTLVAGALPTTKKLVLERILLFLQTTNYIENDDFPAESHEEALDKLTMMVLELKDQVDRMMLKPIDDSSGQTTYEVGLDASKPTTPGAGDVYMSTDTLKLHVCFVAGTWVSIN